jgi:cysteine protease ATG4
MLLAEAIKQIHLTRDWRWTVDTRDETYLKIVSRFEDNKAAVYGIHQIALMGEDSGKNIGEWFSPNIVSQVIK